MSLKTPNKSVSAVADIMLAVHSKAGLLPAAAGV
jgi:hypothetical protein